MFAAYKYALQVLWKFLFILLHPFELHSVTHPSTNFRRCLTSSCVNGQHTCPYTCDTNCFFFIKSNFNKKLFIRIVKSKNSKIIIPCRVEVFNLLERFCNVDV